MGGGKVINILNEITRKNLVGKTKAQSATRFNKRLQYSSNPVYIGTENSELIKDDECVAYIKVGKYTDVVAFTGVIETILGILENLPKPVVTLAVVTKAVSQALDICEDVLVDCDCGDFIYRFAYWATEYGYKYGKPQNKPSEVTNPEDDKGAVCKHLANVLSNKKWLVKIASDVSNNIKLHYDDVIDTYNIDPEQFIVPNAVTRKDLEIGDNDPIARKGKSVVTKGSLKNNTSGFDSDNVEVDSTDNEDDELN